MSLILKKVGKGLELVDNKITLQFNFISLVATKKNQLIREKGCNLKFIDRIQT